VLVAQASQPPHPKQIILDQILYLALLLPLVVAGQGITKEREVMEVPVAAADGLVWRAVLVIHHLFLPPKETMAVTALLEPQIMVVVAVVVLGPLELMEQPQLAVTVEMAQHLLYLVRQ
jgi:hypothetical protein